MEFCENDNENFASWSKAKNSYNYRLNRAIFNYLGRREFFEKNGLDKENDSQLLLEIITEIIDKHFRYRYNVYYITKKIGFQHKKIFILSSLIITYLFEIIKIIHCLKNLGLRFELNNSEIYDSVYLAIKFPSHSFSIPDQVSTKKVQSAKTFSSFGEFLLYYMTDNKNKSVLSLDEYQRHSKIAEKNTKNINNFEKEVESFPRILIKKSRSFAAIFYDFRLLLNSVSKLKCLCLFKFNIVIHIKHLHKISESIKYAEFISLLESIGKKVELIFILPFNSLGCIKYDSKLNGKILTYNYGDNLFIAPSPYLQSVKGSNSDFVIKDLLSEVSLWGLGLTGMATGFTDIFYDMDIARRNINEKYGCMLSVNAIGKIKQRPVAIGYEIYNLNFTCNNFKNIAVFDVPPDERRHQLERALAGDRASDFKFCKEFLLDIAELADNNDIRILLKPKYSLSNYSLDYRSLINLIKKKLGNKFVMMSPYSRVGSIIDASDVCLNSPYTSARAFGEEFGKQSYYYVPEGYRMEFETNCGNFNLLIGRTELCKQLFS